MNDTIKSNYWSIFEHDEIMKVGDRARITRAERENFSTASPDSVFQ